MRQKFIVGLAAILMFSSVTAALACPQEIRVQKEKIRRQPARKVVRVVTPPYREREVYVAPQRERIILREVAPHCSCNGY